MKNFFTILFLLMATISFSQVEGVWYLAEQEGALAVGPNIGDGSCGLVLVRYHRQSLFVGRYDQQMEILQMVWC